jgi:uncharacterized integral membrane protein
MAEDQEKTPPHPTPARPTYGGQGIPWGFAASLLLAVLVVVFAVQNTQPVEITFLAWSWTFPLAIVLSAVVVAAVVADEVLGWLLRRRRRLRREERDELRRLRGE